MPVSVNRTPFGAGSGGGADEPMPLRTPQARVLEALMPQYADDPLCDWPTVNRAQLGIRAGYNTVGGVVISGTVTRALNGIRPGSSSGDPHPGLLSLGYVEELVFDIEGVKEVNYRITAAGVAAYQAHISAAGGLPPPRDAASCVNLDQGKGDTHRSKRK